MVCPVRDLSTSNVEQVLETTTRLRCLRKVPLSIPKATCIADSIDMLNKNSSNSLQFLAILALDPLEEDLKNNDSVLFHKCVSKNNIEAISQSVIPTV